MYHYYPLAPEYCLLIIIVCVVVLFLCHIRHWLRAKAKQVSGGRLSLFIGVVLVFVKIIFERFGL